MSSRSSVKMWGSGTSFSRFELENAGLRNELDPFWAWNASLRNCQDASGWRSGRLLTRGTAECFAFGLSRPWEAMNGLKVKTFWKWWSPELQNPPKNVKWWCSGRDFLVICENDMLRNGNSGLKMGVLSHGTYPICIHMEVPPPPPRVNHTEYWLHCLSKSYHAMEHSVYDVYHIFLLSLVLQMIWSTNFQQNSDNLMKNWLKILWKHWYEYANECWWCHSLTTCYIFCTLHFENLNILPKLVIVCPSYQDVLELTLFCIYSERNYGRSNILMAEIWNFCHFCVQIEWKIMRRWHQLIHLHIHIDWSRNVSWKFAKLQTLYLFFNWFSSGFHCFVQKIYYFFWN